ncbi:autophagy protein 13 [Paramarasmius palmivorus]|uniref:Autophagy protein 13 n=1 Tax=Paramarasmius palmivorus TaxID=297713 RepID=A0AAW0EET0_9AGAR
MGSLNLTATYLSTPNFRLDELESLLSSRFMSMDTGPEFTPTLVKNQQRDSLLSTHEGSPGSLPLRTSLPLSPPRDIVRPNSRLPSNSSRPISRATPEDAESIAERFVLPSRTASTGTSPPHLGQHRALPITRATTTTSTTTAGSSPSGALARLRKESLQRATTSDSYLPGSTSTSSHPFPSSVSSTSSIPPATSSPILVRRPALNPVNPFKSGTLSDRTSQASGLGLGFPTSGGIGSGAGTGGASGSPSSFSSSLRNQPSPMSSTGLPSLSNFPRTGGPPHSPIIPGSSLGTGTGIGKPSPPVEGGGSISSETGGTTRKRYSSSFGHRYTSGGTGGPVVGSAGSVGSGSGSGSVGVGGIPPAGRMSVEGSPNPRPRELPGRHSRTSSLGQGVPMRAVEKEGSSSYMGTATDDDDISEFVQDIDSRKPLSGRSRILSGARKDSRPDSPVITAEPEAESESAPSPQAPTYISHAQQPSSSSTTSTGTGSRTIRMPSGTIVPGTGSRASTLTIDSTAAAGTRTSTLDSPTRSPIDIRTFDPRSRTSRSSSLNQQVTAASPPAGSGPMLTSQTEVEDKLKKMNEMFLASLEGLGSGSGSGSGSSRQRGSAESSPVSSTRPPLSSGMGTGARPGMYHRRSGSGSGRGSPLPLMFTDRERRGSQGSEEVIGRLELSGK